MKMYVKTKELGPMGGGHAPGTPPQIRQCNGMTSITLKKFPRTLIYLFYFIVTFRVPASSILCVVTKFLMSLPLMLKSVLQLACWHHFSLLPSVNKGLCMHFKYTLCSYLSTRYNESSMIPA